MEHLLKAASSPRPPLTRFGFFAAIRTARGRDIGGFEEPRPQFENGFSGFGTLSDHSDLMQTGKASAGNRLLPAIKRQALAAIALLLPILETTLGAQSFNLPGCEQGRRGLQLRLLAGLQRDSDALGKTNERDAQDQNRYKHSHQ